MKAFVVKIVQSTLPVPPGAPLSAAQFSSEELRIYRATDGKRLLAVRVGSPSLSRDGYALAPDASQLAVLTRDQVVVWSVPGNMLEGMQNFQYGFRLQKTPCIQGHDCGPVPFVRQSLPQPLKVREGSWLSKMANRRSVLDGLF